MQVTTIDVETFYDAAYTLKKLTTSEYVRDPRFEVIGVGVRETCGDCGGVGGFSSFTAGGSIRSSPCYSCDKGVVRRWFEAADFRKWAEARDWSRRAVLAHHTHFDGLILAHHFGIIPGFYLDTLSMARALHGTDVGGSLAALSQHYQVGEKGHEVEDAKGKHRSDFTPEEWAAYGRYCLLDTDLTYAIFRRMAEGYPEDELDLIDQTIRMFTDPKFVLDKPRLERFLAYEQERKAELLQRIGADRPTLQSSDKLAEVFRALGVEPPTKTSPKTGEQIYAFAKSDAGMQDLLEDPRDEIRWLAEARIAVKSTINETRTGRLLRMADHGPMPIYLKYAGAHTHRDAGGDKINPQNFQRGGEIRNSITVEGGYKIVVADSGAIEARTNAYLAGHTDLVTGFVDQDLNGGLDVYSKFASKAYRRPVDRKKNKDDFIPGFVGKTAVLGLGYGMGWQKFAATLLAGALGGPPVVFDRVLMESLGVSLGEFTADPRKVQRVREMKTRLAYEDLLVHCAVAEEFVRQYRSENQAIVQFWGQLQDMLPTLARPIPELGRVDLDGHTLEAPVLGVGPLRAAYQAIEFPTGLPLRYPGLREDYGEGWSYYGGKRKPHVRLYGGKVCENVVQKFARNVVFDQALTIQRKTGYRPSLRTHDELVFVAPESEAEALLETVLSVMKTAPAWAPGLPLNAEGGVGDRYGEIK